MVIGTDLYLSSYSYRNVAAAFCEASLKYVLLVTCPFVHICGAQFHVSNIDKVTLTDYQ